MLDQKTINLVKSTAPFLQQHAEILSQHFYKRMFSHYPEVIPLFNLNQFNQISSHQQKALASAIIGYAANIDNLAALGDAVELIAHKHASLQIQPEHYPIVGENLLASFGEILGGEATEEIIQAWRKAYAFLADILMQREKQIYDENAQKTYGWTGFKKFIVVRKEKESSIITSFYLKPEDQSKVPAYLAGQYITVRVLKKEGYTTMRNYSLSDKPGQDYFRISVKRESSTAPTIPKGFVSNQLHDDIEVGNIVEVAPPCGTFFLNTASQEKPLVLLAAGIGITPLLSMLKTALETMPHRHITFIHACLNEEVQAFKASLDTLAKKHTQLTVHYCYSDPAVESIKRKRNAFTGVVTPDLIDALIPTRHADYYFCGPHAFMINIYHTLLKWGIPKSQVHFEFFGPQQTLDPH